MTTKSRAIPELSIDTQTLERLLATTAVGEVMPYTRLSDAIGRDVQNGAVHLLTSARHRLQREHQMVFAPVRGQGLKRLDDLSIALSGDGVRSRVHNLARRATQRLACVQDFEALPNDAKVKHNTSLSVFGFLSEMTKASAVKKIEGKIGAAGHDTLPVGKFLDAMKATL